MKDLIDINNPLRLFALLVGIDDYPIDPISGAVQDVENVSNYLRYERSVPAENIVMLTNEQATRRSILDAFRAHLIENSNIIHGDAILFHYSGHGSRGAAPEGWALGAGGGREVEFIVPIDSVRDPSLAALGEESGIPDRTLGALLRRLAREKGNNVTVVFDCCHSGHGTRSVGAPARRYRTRKIHPRIVGALSADTDRDIWGTEDASMLTGSARGSFLDESHILLAACTRTEEAIGNDLGGLFTTIWVEVLREGRARTYADALRAIQEKLTQKYREMEGWPEEDRPVVQHPQCEGVNRDRQLFEAFDTNKSGFAVLPAPGSARCRISAGTVLGIKAGTIFELRQTSHHTPIHETEIILGSAVALEVFPAYCIAEVPRGVYIAPRDVRASVTKLAQALKYAVVNTKPNSPAAVDALERLERRMERAPPSASGFYERTSDADAAQLVLEVDEEVISFSRRDPQLAHLDTPTPTIKTNDIETVFPDVMNYLARFTFYLSLESPSRNFAEQVEMCLFNLQRPATYTDDEYMPVGTQVSFSEDGEAVVPHDEDALYALVLRNHSDVPLFPYVILFDPSTYTVDFFYTPPNPDDPPLKPHGELQLGRSEECLAALWFVADPEGRKDTGFLKVLFATEGNLELKFMQQRAVVGYDEMGDPNYLSARHAVRAGSSTKPIKGSWDVMTRRVTVLPPEK